MGGRGGVAGKARGVKEETRKGQDARVVKRGMRNGLMLRREERGVVERWGRLLRC